VIIVADGWHSAAFVKVDFLGRPVYFSTGAMSVARLTGSPVVPLFTVGAPPAGLRFVFEEPIVPDPHLDTAQDIERMIGRYVGRLEHHLRDNIPCWQHWFEEEALVTMANLPSGSLADRYDLGPRPKAARGS
jgi:predicted LPLAT superfamily acyltransferase